MNVFELLLTAVALAMDAFTVSIASGLSARRFHMRHALTLGLWFGGFQAVMPLLGWASGLALRKWISFLDHWVAFILLAFIGLRMIYESFKLREARQVEELTAPKEVLCLAVATSIDAYVVGVSLAMVRGGPVLAAVVIGCVTFLISAAGVWIGARGFERMDNRVEIAGGLILIGLGLKILIQHTLTGGRF